VRSALPWLATALLRSAVSGGDAHWRLRGTTLARHQRRLRGHRRNLAAAKITALKFSIAPTSRRRRRSAARTP